MTDRILLLVQLAGTLAIIAWVPTNLGKAAALLCWWLLTFKRLSKPQVVLYLCVCGFFALMNVLSLRQGVFYFRNPDVLGMPLYEFLMWGYYILHTLQFIKSEPPRSNAAVIWGAAILFAAAFATIPDQRLLLLVTGIVLLASLIVFHERLDWAYVGYMVLLGAAVEYTGTISSQWAYPGEPWGGVPLWFIPLWGGVGLFLRRLVLPLYARYESVFRRTHHPSTLAP